MKGRKEVFTYSASFVHSTMCVYLLEIAGLGGAGLYLAITAVHTGRNYIYAGVLCGALAAFFVYAFARFYLQHRPLRITSDGIETLSFGRRWLFISWKDVRCIEKIDYFEALKGRQSTMFYIHCPNGKIQFDANIQDVHGLLARLNEYIAQHGIAVTWRDRGKDARDEIKRSVADPVERKRLLREGRRRRLSAL